MRQLDFKQNKVEVLTLSELESTYHENLVTGQPVGGIYHFDIIAQVQEAFASRGLKPEITEIFAADNRDSKRPGVTLLPQLEQQYGERAIEAHLLRRVYANIAIRDDETPEMVTNLAVAYHQKGIQVAIGPMVKVCHNQCIIGSYDVASNYKCWGNQKVSNELTIEGVLKTVSQWAAEYGDDQKVRVEEMEGMKLHRFTTARMYKTIGVLQEQRIMHDSDNSLIHSSQPYALNSSQINSTCEKLLVEMKERGNDEMTFWDAYQCLNSVLKPQKMDMPQILPQGLMLWDTLYNIMIGFYDGK
jgi:hypothetical protein